MADRKQTPDVLGEILGLAASAPAPSIVEPSPAGPSRMAPSGMAPSGMAPSAPPRRSPALEPSAPRLRAIAWEHRVVSFQNYRGWRPRYVNGGEVGDWMSGPQLHEYLEQAGAEGWEVAGAAAGQPLYGSSDGYQVFLKREKRQA